MSQLASSGTKPQSCPDELDALISALTDAIEALVAWNIPEFQSAVDRQRAICDNLAFHSGNAGLAITAETARKVQDLNRVYDRLLQHSLHWTRTIGSIIKSSGNALPRRPSVHFRG